MYGFNHKINTGWCEFEPVNYQLLYLSDDYIELIINETNNTSQFSKFLINKRAVFFDHLYVCFLPVLPSKSFNNQVENAATR